MTHPKVLKDSQPVVAFPACLLPCIFHYPLTHPTMPALISRAQREAWKAALRDPTLVQARHTYCDGESPVGNKPGPTVIKAHCCIAVYAEKVLGLTPKQIAQRIYPRNDFSNFTKLGIDGAIPEEATHEFIKLNDSKQLSFAEIADKVDEVLDKYWPAEVEKV